MPATLTSRLKLIRAALVDAADITVNVNPSFDIIDAEVGVPKVAASSPLPSVPYDGQIRRDVNDGYLKIWDAVNSAWIRITPGPGALQIGGGGSWVQDNTPNWSNVTVGIGFTYWQEYLRMPGNMVFLKAGFILGTGGSLASSLSYDLPAPVPIDVGAGVLAAKTSDVVGYGIAEATGGGARTVIAARLNVVGPPGSLTFTAANLSGSSAVNSTVPFTWAAGSRFNFMAMYRTSAAA